MRTSAPTRTLKMNSAATSPPTRVSSSGPMPMPRRWSRVAGIVMLFHSPMSRMNSTLPDAVDGDSVPKTASWRRYHGATATANSATAPSAAAERDPGGARARRRTRASPAVPEERRAQHDQDQHAVVARERREAGQQPGEGERPAVAPQARAPPATAPRPRAAGRARSCPAGPCTRRTGPGTPSGRRADAHERGGARVAPDRPRQRGGDGTDQRERDGRGHARSAPAAR